MHFDKELLWAYLTNEIDATNRQMIKEHLKSCVFCSKELSVLESEELFFKNIDYPIPSESFSLKTSERIISKVRNRKQPWKLVFKTCLFISLLLILVIFSWLVMNLSIDLSILDKTGAIVLYILPLVLFVFVMKTFEGKMIQN
jgi:predicted anti-sigma-YlaC factor YlaD